MMRELGTILALMMCSSAFAEEGGMTIDEAFASGKVISITTSPTVAMAVASTNVVSKVALEKSFGPNNCVGGCIRVINPQGIYMNLICEAGCICPEIRGAGGIVSDCPR